MNVRSSRQWWWSMRASFTCRATSRLTHRTTAPPHRSASSSDVSISPITSARRRGRARKRLLILHAAMQDERLLESRLFAAHHRVCEDPSYWRGADSVTGGAAGTAASASPSNSTSSCGHRAMGNALPLLAVRILQHACLHFGDAVCQRIFTIEKASKSFAVEVMRSSGFDNYAKYANTLETGRTVSSGRLLSRHCRSVCIAQPGRPLILDGRPRLRLLDCDFMRRHRSHRPRCLSMLSAVIASSAPAAASMLWPSAGRVRRLKRF